MHHPYLAVDFFFGLADFVVAYAEYLGNIAYALILRRLRTITLAVIVGLSGLLLIWTANTKGSLDGGWGYPEIWMAPLRLTVFFVMGLWLYRIHDYDRPHHTF
jgi:hypothetical protein